MENNNTSKQQITFRLWRYDPDVDAAPHWEKYEVTVAPGITVLEALQHIKQQQEPTLAWRSSCRMGICGSCGMFINELPRLACQTQVLHLKSSEVTVAPLPNYPHVKDLVPDMMPMFEKHAAVRPYLIRPESNGNGEPSGELLQTPEEREEYGQFSICIKCGLCMSACPTLATDVHFLGPQPLAQAYRYTADSRDDGLQERLEALDAVHGPYQCHMAGACTMACPKGVDPAFAIQLLKRSLSLDALRLRRRKRPSAPVPLPTQYIASDEIAPPPPRTVQVEAEPS
jgi:succinate dehydrogenase / fumarate reductase, iron-sulfur subunit